jgi:hypothetical protein
MVTASSTGGSPTTTTPPRQTQAAVPGLAERHPPATNASATVNAAPARSGIGQGLLPFTGLDSRALLLVAAMLMGVGGWLLVWASRVKHAQPARYR